MKSKIYCQQVEAITLCDCLDKCDGYKVALKTTVSSIIFSALSGIKSNTVKDCVCGVLGSIEIEIHKAIDNDCEI